MRTDLKIITNITDLVVQIMDEDGKHLFESIFFERILG